MLPFMVLSTFVSKTRSFEHVKKDTTVIFSAGMVLNKEYLYIKVIDFN